MKADFFPGFEDDVRSTDAVAATDAIAVEEVHRNPDRPRHENSHPGLSAFALRARQFTRWLSAARLTAIAARSRFYSMPWLRRADEPIPDDDLLP